MRSRFFNPYFVAAAGLVIVTTSCSSPVTPTAVVSPTTNTAVTPATNKGLCKLVAPSVIATALSESMTFPTTLAHGSTTECVYKAKEGYGGAMLIRYDTNSSTSTFTKSKETFERRGLKLGAITGLGDQAYYFSAPTGQLNVTTVVLARGSLQLLVTGSATLDQIGSIARYALDQFESQHSPVPAPS